MSGYVLDGLEMWVYQQSTGELTSPTGTCLAKGYSGIGAGKNNPEMQGERNIGPIPQGSYTIGAAFDSPKHGPHCVYLKPDPADVMYGRSGFLMHGDSMEHQGYASEGCIIMPRAVRELVSHSPIKSLVVIT